MGKRVIERELPQDRLATADSKGNRIYLYPADVKGYFRSLRTKVISVLILFFLVLPWIPIRGQQAVLIDIPHRRFALFGITFWAHDAPLLIFIVGAAILSLAFVTMIWGRVWCGWACPQTVFVEGVFRKIERWIEGDAIERRKLDGEAWGLSKIIKKASKWICFVAVAAIISHSFLAYFVGTQRLGQMIQTSPLENPINFFLMLGVTAAILFDFGWFREQFCTLVCPYGRFQSVMMDPHSLVVAYDVKRGEPRRGIALSEEAQGDCVNCYRCVQVCPTGIDIRRGVQLECIACTSCIDACDEVMTRLKKAKGLIRYDSMAKIQDHEKIKSAAYRGKVWAYGGLLSVFVLGFSYLVLQRQPLEAVLIRAVGQPYEERKQGDGSVVVLNHFKLDLRNQSFEAQAISPEVTSDIQTKAVRVVLSRDPVSVQPGENERVEVFIEFPKSLLMSGHAKLILSLTSKSNLGRFSVPLEVNLVGPFI